MSDPDHHTAARCAALTSWGNTVDRTARTRPARTNSPGSIEYFLARLPQQFDDATNQQRMQAAESARKAYFQRLAWKSAKARRRGSGDAAALPAPAD